VLELELLELELLELEVLELELELLEPELELLEPELESESELESSVTSNAGFCVCIGVRFTARSQRHCSNFGSDLPRGNSLHGKIEIFRFALLFAYDDCPATTTTATNTTTAWS
jgi:hypothetical protein